MANLRIPTVNEEWELQPPQIWQKLVSEVGTGDPIAVTDASLAAALADPASSSGQLFAGKVSRGDLVADVRDFGAVGDGSTDDTAAVQAAMYSLPQGGTVLIPAGVFTVGGLTVPARVTLTGAGQGKIRVQPGAAGAVIHLTGDGAEVTDLGVVGNSAMQTSTSQVVVLVSAEACRVSGVRITDAYDRGVVVEPSVTHAVVESCVVSDSGVLDNCNAFDVRGSYVTVSDCHVYNHGNGHAFRVGNTVDEPPEHVTITGCVVERSSHNAYTVEVGSRFVTIANCVARDVPQAVKGEGATYVTVIGCMFEDVSLGTAFNLQLVDHVLVSGVRLRNAAGGILVGEDSVVTGCEVENIGVGFSGIVHGIYARSGVVSDCVLSNVDGTGVRVGGGVARGCVLTGCGTSSTHYLVLVDSDSPGSGIVGNVVRAPGNGGHPTGTAFCLWGSRGVVQGNVLDGVLPRGVRVVDGEDDYIVMGNVVGSATTPVLEGNGANRSISNNI